MGETSGQVAAGGIVVRETQCRTILNRTPLGDYSLNCYTGCAHGCVYCYARFMQRFHPHDEPWGRFVDVKVNAVEALGRQLRRAKPGSVFVSSACDGWQPLEKERQLTRSCCRELVAHGFEVHALTKSTLILRDLDVLAGGRSRVGVTVTTLDERLRRLWEPDASPVEERFRVLREAREAGLDTAVMFGPLLPMLSDDEASIEAMFQRAGDAGVGLIWVDGLNPRPRVWPAVAALLREEFPDLRERYARLLHDKGVREEYLDGLRVRIERVARRLSLTDRLAECL